MVLNMGKSEEAAETQAISMTAGGNSVRLGQTMFSGQDYAPAWYLAERRHAYLA
jgi:hypothetical protein